MAQRNGIECMAQQVYMVKLYTWKSDWMSVILEAFSKTSGVWTATYFFQKRKSLLWVSVVYQLRELIQVCNIEDGRKKWVSGKSVNVWLKYSGFLLLVKRPLKDSESTNIKYLYILNG